MPGFTGGQFVNDEPGIRRALREMVGGYKTDVGLTEAAAIAARRWMNPTRSVMTGRRRTQQEYAAADAPARAAEARRYFAPGRENSWPAKVGRVISQVTDPASLALAVATRGQSALTAAGAGAAYEGVNSAVSDLAHRGQVNPVKAAVSAGVGGLTGGFADRAIPASAQYDSFAQSVARPSAAEVSESWNDQLESSARGIRGALLASPSRPTGRNNSTRVARKASPPAGVQVAQQTPQRR